MSELLIQAKTIMSKQQLVWDLWESLYQNNIDDQRPGVEGSVQNLLNLFLPLSNLQPMIRRTQYYLFCGLKGGGMIGQCQ